MEYIEFSISPKYLFPTDHMLHVGKHRAKFGRLGEAVSSAPDPIGMFHRHNGSHTGLCGCTVTLNRA